MNNKNDGKFKKGQSGNPSGRPAVLLPEVQRAIDANRNAFKVLLIQKLDPKIEEWVDSIIEKGIAFGDAQSFRTVAVLAFGKGIEETKELELSQDERLLIETYRRKLAEQKAVK